MAADIPAGLGYLTAGLALSAADVVLVLHRGPVGQWFSDLLGGQVDELIAASDRAPRRRPWMYLWYRDPRLRDVETRSQIAALAWVCWIPIAFMLSLIAALLIAAAVVKLDGR